MCMMHFTREVEGLHYMITRSEKRSQKTTHTSHPIYLSIHNANPSKQTTRSPKNQINIFKPHPHTHINQLPPKSTQEYKNHKWDRAKKMMANVDQFKARLQVYILFRSRSCGVVWGRLENVCKK